MKKEISPGTKYAVINEGADTDTESLLGLLNKRGTKVKGYKVVGVAGKALNIVVFLLLVGAVTTCLVVFVFLPNNHNDGPAADELSQCYVSPSCPFENTVPYDPHTGFTNDTGWSSSPSCSSQCCQICLPGTKIVNCFNTSDLTCYNKTGYGDYDYLMLDQMWLPQFCAALELGHDFTLTHLAGSKCLPKAQVPLAWTSNLSIHGLWPNYYHGFPQCCPSADGYATSPLTPAVVATWPIWTQLQAQWGDPTIAADQNCSVCSNLNHEWQKHGTCLTATYLSISPEYYFGTALDLAARIATASAAINDLWGQVVPRSQIEALFGSRVNVICDPRDTSGGLPAETGMFSELQTCWKHDSTQDDEFSMVDCMPSTPQAFTTPCPANVVLR